MGKNPLSFDRGRSLHSRMRGKVNKAQAPEDQSTLERDPDNEAIAARSARFTAMGATVEFARDLPEHVFQTLSGEHRYARSEHYHLEEFYLNSSDAIPEIHRSVEVAGRRVLTVGASFDTAEAFIDNDAIQLDVFDISLPVLFYDELRLVALQELDFETYKRLIYAWKPETFGTEKVTDRNTLFDLDIYKQLRPYLSEQSRAFYDGIQKDSELFRGYGLLMSRFSHARLNERTKMFDNFIGTVISDETAYNELQAKARTTAVEFTWCSANNLLAYVARANNVDLDLERNRVDNEALLPEELTAGLAGVEVVNLSNIEYLPPDQIALAKKFLEAGVNRVIIALSPNRTLYRPREFFMDQAGEIVMAKGLGQRRNYRIDPSLRQLLSFETQILKPGDEITVSGNRIKVLDYNLDIEFGLVVELTKGV